MGILDVSLLHRPEHRREIWLGKSLRLYRSGVEGHSGGADEFGGFSEVKYFDN